MATESQEEGILRYLKEMDYEFFELFGKPGTQFEYDHDHIAREAMTKSAQLRLTNASFPQELRLQVMKASVLYHSSPLNIFHDADSDATTKKITNAAKFLFDTRHASGALYNTLKELAEQAFFEAAIFRVHTCISLHGSSECKIIARLHDEILERVQHLELTIRILPRLGWEATLENAASLWTSLRLISPKLKACVLTVVVQSLDHRFDPSITAAYYISDDQSPFPKEMLDKGPLDGECLSNTLMKLFAEFAEKGLGVRRFIRIKHDQCDLVTSSATPHYGPLVAVHSARSGANAHESPSGASMLTAAYQVARTGGKVKHDSVSIW